MATVLGVVSAREVFGVLSAKICSQSEAQAGPEHMNSNLSTSPAVSELICSNLQIFNIFPYKKNFKNAFPGSAIAQVQGSKQFKMCGKNVSKSLVTWVNTDVLKNLSKLRQDLPQIKK